MPPLVIESPNNPRLKAVSRLREKRGRKQAGLYLIDGARECQRALEAQWPIVTLIYCPELLDTGVGKTFDLVAWCSRMQQRPAEETSLWDNSQAVWELRPEAFAKIAYGERTDGVMAIARSQPHTLEQLPIPANPLLVVVESLEKPGNLGAIFRTADAAGADAVILADSLVDPENPNVLRASLGTVFSVPFAIATSGQTQQWLMQNDVQMVAAMVDASQSYTQINYQGPTAVVLGSEADGLKDTWRQSDVLPVRIPMAGRADSLNVSVSAAVILYEAVRQRDPGSRR